LTIDHDRALYTLRDHIERMFGQLKINQPLQPDTTNAPKPFSA